MKTDETMDWRNLFEAAVEAAGQVLYEWRPRSNRVTLRGPVQELFGWSEDRGPANLEEWLERIHPDDTAAFLEECKRAERDQDYFRLIYRIRHNDGSWIWVEDRGSHTVDLEGHPLVLGFVQDITLRVTRDLELRQRNERAQLQRTALAELSAIDLADSTVALRRILAVLANTLGIERVSFWKLENGPAAIECEHLYERTAGRWSSGARLLESDFPAYFEAMQRGAVICATDAHSDPRTSEFRDGYLVPNRIRAMLDVPVWEDGRLAGVVCNEHVGSAPREWTLDEQEFALAIANLVSRLLASRVKKRMEAQLLLADRMSSMGLLVAGVAHEINNPLAYLLASVGFLSDEMAQIRAGKKRVEGTVLDDMESALADAVEGARRVRNIVSDLRMFSRDKEPRATIDVRKPIEAAVRMATGEIKKNAQIELALADATMVEASESRLGQVMLNLLMNASQAMPARPKEENRIRISSSRGGGRVVIEIADNGSGVPADIRAHIFDPFFTTKDVGKGTGLGLSICHSIITGFGGEISVESEPGSGSVFRISLPEAGKSSRDSSPQPPATRTDTIRP